MPFTVANIQFPCSRAFILAVSLCNPVLQGSVVDRQGIKQVRGAASLLSVLVGP